MHGPQWLIARLVFASLICTGASAAPTPAPLDKTGLQSILQAEYDNMNAAEAHGHAARYLSYHTTDYNETDPTGQHTDIHGRQQDRANAIHVAQWLRHFDATDSVPFYYRDKVKSLNIIANTITVTAEEHCSIQPVVEQERDVWVNRGGHWLMKQRQHGRTHTGEW